jgi:hypothetical protein
MGHILEIEDGFLYSSGDNQYGQLGIGNVRLSPERYKVITNDPKFDDIPWVSAYTGANHSIAIKEDRSIWFWGSNIEGQMGLPEDVLYITSPIKKDFSFLNPNKPIDINVGLNFTLISQTNEKSYGLGDFQNLGDRFPRIYREPTVLFFNDPDGEAFLTVDTGPKTIIARISSGSQVYSDWSGDLIPRVFTTFDRLNIGDFFTLDDPFNRERLVYKKIDTFQISLGCCPVNALCMHRKYRELQTTVEAVYPSMSAFTLQDLITENRPSVLPTSEQYGADYSFKSALAGVDYMSSLYPDKLDPWTLKGMMLATGAKSLLDIIIYGGLYFSSDPNDEFNQKTPVEKINAIEIFTKGPFPEYFEEVGSYKVLPGDPFNLHTSSPDNSIPLNFYFQTVPLYYFKINENKEPLKYQAAHKFWLYTEFCEPISELEKDIFNLFLNPGPGPSPNDKFGAGNGFFYAIKNEKDPSDPKIIYKTIGWPVDENNRVIIEDLVLTPPYLIKYELTEGQSAFSQNFVDPYIRIRLQQPDDEIPTCNGWNNEPPIDPELTDWLYACYVVVDAFAAGGRRYITYNIGPAAKALIEYFLAPRTDPELTKQFFGITKIELEELYDTIRNGEPAGPPRWDPIQAQIYEKTTGDSFRFLRDIFNTQLQSKIIFDEKTLNPIIKTSARTLSTANYVSILSASSSRGYFPQSINIPLDKIVCYTYYSRDLVFIEDRSEYRYKTDKETLIVPYNVTGKIAPGVTQLSYWVRSPNWNEWKENPGKKENGEYFQEIDYVFQRSVNILIKSVSYDKALNITKILLDRPMNVDYLIGCVRVRTDRGLVCGPILNLEIYYNNYSFSIIEALSDNTGLLI